MQSSSTPRYPSCNGLRIRALRQARGWTQSELAERSGYSLRLIQKAEGGGALSPATLDVLAESLGTDAEIVSIEELISTPESIARQFHVMINEHSEKIISIAPHLFAEDVVSFCAGDPDVIPFAGERQGIEGFDEYLRAFFSTLVPSPQGLFQNIQYLSNGSQVVCWLEAHAKVAGMPDPTPPMWVWQRYVIEDGKIVRYANHFDTQVGAAHLAEARAKSLLAEDTHVENADGLVTTPESVVREFVSIINDQGANTGPASAHLIANEFTMWCAGDPDEMPFAGDRVGIDGLTDYFRTFFSMLAASEHGLLRNVHYLSNGQQVACWSEAHAKVVGMPGPEPVVFVWMRFLLREGKIVRFENHFDTQVGAAHLAEARARSLLAETLPAGEDGN